MKLFNRVQRNAGFRSLFVFLSLSVFALTFE